MQMLNKNKLKVEGDNETAFNKIINLETNDVDNNNGESNDNDSESEIDEQLLQSVNTKGNFENDLKNVNQGNKLLMDDIIDDMNNNTVIVLPDTNTTSGYDGEL